MVINKEITNYVLFYMDMIKDYTLPSDIGTKRLCIQYIPVGKRILLKLIHVDYENIPRLVLDAIGDDYKIATRELFTKIVNQGAYNVFNHINKDKVFHSDLKENTLVYDKKYNIKDDDLPF